MRKENVFLVALRQRNVAGIPCGMVVNYVICGLNKDSVRSYVEESLPNFVILSAVNLVMLETMVKKIKNTVDGKEGTVLVK